MTMTFSQFDLGLELPADANVHAAMALPKRPGMYRNAFKRVLDVTAIAMAAPVILPVVLGLAVLIARDGGKPFYSQMRVGKGGKRFRMWKLRSMVCDADDRMEEYLSAHPEARLEWDTTQKLRNDPRITKMGRILRQTSLDELPQLWNVLMGEMSLVGPRPIMVSQQMIYPGVSYYLLRPGCTGYWQTAGRNRTTFQAREEYDTAYEANLSLKTDIKILIDTVGVMVNGTGC
jgi:exopolysaccharide production protein ExoY